MTAHRFYAIFQDIKGIKNVLFIALFLPLLISGKAQASGANPLFIPVFSPALSEFTGFDRALTGIDETVRERRLMSAKNHYRIATSVTGEGSILLEPDQHNYEEGSFVQLTANPELNWSFNGWSGDVTGIDNPVTLTMDGDKAVSASFLQTSFTLSVNTTGNGSVSKNPDQTVFNDGETVDLTATADPGWTFTGWSGDASGSANPLTVTMDADKNITATFTQTTYTLTVNATGSGTVSKNPDQTTFNSGETVDLTANPAAGWSFSGWSGGGTSGSTNPITVTMDANKTVTATFTQNTYTLTLNATGNGSVSKNPDQTTFNSGETVELTATPAAGWSFSGWSGGTSGSTNPITVTMDANKTVTATFTQNTYTLTVNTTGSGSVSKNPDQTTFNSGETVDLTATPAAGWSFSGWSGGTSGSTDPITVTMDANKTVTATFTQNTYTLTVNTTGNGSVSKNPDQTTFNSGETVELTATPDAGWSFSGWSGGGTSGSTNPITVTMDANKTVTATFTQNTYTLTINKIGSGTVSKNPDQTTFNSGETVDLTANPAAGWSFSGWSGGASGSTNPITVTMDANKSITAAFTQNTFQLTLETDGTPGAVVSPSGNTTVNEGDAQPISVTTVPSGYTFQNWTISSGSAVIADASAQSTTVTLTGNATIQANFAADPFTLSVSVTGSGTVSKDPDLTAYDPGTHVDLTANPDPSWMFANWSGDLSGSANPVTLTMNADKTVMANFAATTYQLTVLTDGTTGSAVSPSGTTMVNEGEAQAISVSTVPSGYSFVNWTGEAGSPSIADPSSQSTTVTLSTGDATVQANFVQDTYTLTVNTTGSGSVSKNPNQTTFNSGATVDLTATPVAGWSFSGWSGDASGSVNPLTVTMNANKTIMATFTQDTYTLTVNTTGSGSVSKNPNQTTFNSGATVDLTATPAAGWSFSGWSGDALGSVNPLTVTMNANKTITATFSQDTYTLTVNTTGSGSVSKNPNQTTFNSGATVDLTATPVAGWSFSGWSGDASGSVNPLTVTMNANKTITATFTQDTYTLTVNTTGSGSVSKNPNQTTFNSGATVDLTATPVAGWSFSGWSGDASGSVNPLTVTMNANKTITATFTQDTYTLTVNTTGSGSVSKNPNQTTFNSGATVDLTATPVAGWSFSGWSGDASGSVNPLTVTMNANKTIMATFTQDTYTLTVNTTGSGTVSKNPNQTTFNSGETVELTATPAAGWSFSGWSGDALGSVNPLMVTMNANKTITATFTQITYSLTVNTTGSGTVSKNPNQTTFNSGETVELTATPAAGWSFSGWSGGGTSGSTNPITVTMDANKTVTAAFTQNTYTLTVNTTGSGTFSKNPDQTTFNSGETVVLTATPSAGWSFSGWSGDALGSVNPLTVTMNANKTITATFTQITYTLTVKTTGSGSVTKNPNQTTFNSGETVELTANPSAGWSFSGWSGDASGSTNPLSVTMNANKTITGNFSQITYELTVETDGTPGATVNPSGTVSVGQGVSQSLSVSNVPSGYSFNNWTVTAGTATIANANAANTSVTLSSGNATVQANFKKFPEIQNVTIPNQSMKIGDVVTALISVFDDGGKNYSLVSGTIGGYTLGNLHRLTSTGYTATFTINAGGTSFLASQDIPVTNLVLSDGTNQNPPFSKSISQGSDPIDAKAPVINLIHVQSGNKKIGDQVVLIINADGTGYSLNPTSTVNGISVTETNMSYEEVGGGSYAINYTVRAGDTDVGPGELKARILMNDPAGNPSSPVTSLQNVSAVTIDAHAPVVQGMQVPSGDIGPGGNVTVTVHADGNGYTSSTATTINGVSISSSRVTFTEQSGGDYTLSYTVATGDNEVPRGGLQVRLYLRDAAGNVAGPFSNIDANSLLIYTSLPTASLSGTQSVCEGDNAGLSITLTGKSPWSIKLSNGSTTDEYTSINNSSFQITLSPVTTHTYTITEVKDVHGTTNTGSGSAKVTVNSRTDVQITNLQSAYNVTDDPVLLQASVAGGTFSGPGVNSSTGYFDPGVADTTNSPHTIVYSYTNPSGCVSMDTAIVFVLGAEGDVYIPKPVYCDFNNPFTVTAANGAGATGTFKLLNPSGSEVPGLTDNHNNTAVIDPGSLAVGSYKVIYEYTDIIPLSLEKGFSVETASQPSFLTPGKTVFCQNEAPVALTSNVSGATFQGPGVTGDIENGFKFDPSKGQTGDNTLTVTSSSTNGCSLSATKVVKVNFAPALDFSTDKVCVSSEDTIKFLNTTGNNYMVSGWKWDFDDPASGSKNTSIMEAPEHLFTSGGTHNITLIGETAEGCADTLVKQVNFHTRPVGSFTWTSDCFNGSPTLFSSQMQTLEPVTSYQWSIVNPGSKSFGTNNDSASYTFETLGDYTIRLYAETSGGCGNTVEKTLSLKPIVNLSANWPYQEDFNGSQQSWSKGQADSSEYNSWNYNNVDFSNGGSNQTHAWFTDVPPGPASEQSYIISPCYDFRDIERPMVSMDIYRSLENEKEGVVLQARAGNSNWQNVGVPGNGINWYTSDRITAVPGGQGTGWTGKSYSGSDDGWVMARHDLDLVAGKQNVQFRLFYGSNHTSSASEGFGFDNFNLSSRTRNVLLEHFTNASDSENKTANTVVNPLYNHLFDDLVKLEYHTEFPGEDPLNDINPAMPATRVLFYGITSVPYTVLNGGTDNSLRFNYVNSTIEQKDVRIQSLKDPSFDIGLQVEYAEDHLNADVTVTALKDLPAEERIIQVVVYEKLLEGINTQNGESNFLNVAIEMLPNAAGTAEFNSWNKGKSNTYHFTWNYSNVFNVDMLRVASFIQSDLTKEVYQAVADDNTNITTGRRETPVSGPSVRIYPNPANDIVNIEVAAPGRGKCYAEILDMAGRVLLREQINPDENIKQVSLNSLNKGLYFVRISNSRGITWNVTKLVIMK